MRYFFPLLIFACGFLLGFKKKGPVIEVRSGTFGPVSKGKQTFCFLVKNTGTEPLNIAAITSTLGPVTLDVKTIPPKKQVPYCASRAFEEDGLFTFTGIVHSNAVNETKEGTEYRINVLVRTEPGEKNRIQEVRILDSQK